MPHITVELDQPRRLLLTLEAAKQLDKSYGEIGLLTINSRLRNFNIDALERVLHAAMLDAEPNVTLGMTKKRIAEYLKNGGLIAPLFIEASKVLDESGLFNMTKEEDEPVGNAQAAQAT